MKKALVTLEKSLALLIIFLIPTQLALHFWPSYSFVFGIRVDYLSPSIYLSDVLITSLLFLWTLNDFRVISGAIKKYRRILIIGLVFISINLFISTGILISAYKWLKIIEIAFFGLYVYSRSRFVGKSGITQTLFASAGLFSLIGIYQFFAGRTSGLFYLLGERSFNILTPGIALVKLYGVDFIRAYSTFPHPNSLAGFLGIIIILFFGLKEIKKEKLNYLEILIVGFAFLLTFSLSAVLALTFIALFF